MRNWWLQHSAASPGYGCFGFVVFEQRRVRQTKSVPFLQPKIFHTKILPSVPTDVSCLSSGLKLHGTRGRAAKRRKGPQEKHRGVTLRASLSTTQYGRVVKRDCPVNSLHVNAMVCGPTPMSEYLSCEDPKVSLTKLQYPPVDPFFGTAGSRRGVKCHRSSHEEVLKTRNY